ncbi:MAG: V-type ATP synthase subunit I [Candidatus Thermoplasmatota archaeon]|nr:V-type ATP synthase subunit I [Candidatus Thermoplasmatota archaeon]
MKKVSILLHQRYLEEVIRKLHEQGLVQIMNIEKEEPLSDEMINKVEVPSEVALFSTYELRLTKLIDILARTKKSPGGIKAILHPEAPEKKEVHIRAPHEISLQIEQVLEPLEKKILTLEEQIKQVEEQQTSTEETEKQLSLLQEFSVELEDCTESPSVIVITGRTSNLPQLEQHLESSELITIYSQEFGTRKKKEWAVILVAHISEKDKVEKLSREHLTVFDVKALRGSPTDAIKELQQKQQSLEEERQRLLSELKTYAEEHLQEFYALREEIQIERARKEIMKNFMQTQTTSLIKGWALKKNQESIHSIVNTTCDGYCSITFDTPSSNPDNPPIYLDTPKWATTFRTFLELFATPKYHEINPSIFLGIFFIIFFGFMLGDAGYGLVILLLSLFGYLKYGKYSPMLKNWGFLGIWLGLSTTVAGLLMNSFFGDFIPRFIYHDTTRPIYSLNLAGIQLPLDALGDPLTILSISLILGLIHLNLGLALGLIQAIRQKKYKLFLTQHFSWIPLQIGGGLLIGVFILRWELSSVMMYAAIGLTLIGIALLFLHAGPIGFFGITGYVGDWLSYARLLALGLATSGMALAFNVVAELIPALVPVVGIVLLPIALVVLHVANLGIQALGAAVHSLRLQYVEFFNRFYEGGGKEFEPFQIRRKYTRVEK